MSAILLASLVMASAVPATCQPAPDGRAIETAPGVVMHVRTVGSGRPVLLVQAEEDPIAPPGNGAALKPDIGERLSLVSLPHASHAILPEQPQAVAAALAAWFAGERGEPKLQAIIDGAVKPPR